MNLRSTLTVRYVLALVLVALTLVGTHSLATRRIDGIANDARAINLGGMQRMLSQRIALLARELSLSESAAAADELSGELRVALDRMEGNHVELSDEWHARAARGDAPYVELTRANGLDVKVKRYIAFARTLLDLQRWRPHAAVRDSDLPDRLVAIASGGVLAEFDELVRRYERESSEKTGALQRLGTLSMSAGLCLLCIEALFIFQPMIRTVASNVGALREANEELRELGGRITHDLRAPVASSLGLVEVIGEAVADGDMAEVIDANERMRVSLARLDGLVGDLRAAVRIHGAVTEREPVELGAVIGEVIESLEAAIAKNGVRVSTTGRLDGPLHTDRELLRQVLWSLVSNAVKYVDPDKARAVVEVSVGCLGSRVRVDVSDNGIGIPESSRARVFEMFGRFHPEHADGNGLGLYLARRSALAMGAKVDYQPLAGGSRFSLSVDSGKPLAT